ncbi:MAG TPA: radical SAM protein [Desulfomonilaceae bacterium]|nr:radical SAM protein [Desulfomonilaceae bacterium]
MARPKESGAVIKPRGTTIPVALVYPNEYRLGMGNLGFQFLYHRLNSHPLLSAERFFFSCSSWTKQTKSMPVSEETGRPLSEFAVIAFSVPFESDYPAIPAALMAAGVPPRARDRRSVHPLVIAGGVSVSMNPEPIAEFLDIAYIGELEDSDESAPGLLSTLAQAWSISAATRRDPQSVAELFSHIPGVYIPSAYSFDFGEQGVISRIRVKPGFPERIQAVKRRAKESPVPVSVLFTPEAEFGESLLVETNRGCGRGCRFCAAGWIHFPVRHAEYGSFRDDVDRALASGRTVGLVGSDLAGHPDLEDILTDIVTRGGTFSLSSIRPEGLTPKIVELMAATGQKTATLAPEVATLRMKRVIGKNIANERFYDLVEMLVAGGIPNIRFYFMIGLPTETDEDAAGIVDFVIEARRLFVDASRPVRRIGRLGVQVNPFVPKPWTPFQWAGMASARELGHRMRIIHDGLLKHPNVLVRMESHKQAAIQAFLSRGDRRISGAILAAANQAGRWSGVLKKEGIDPDFYVLRKRTENEIFPWDLTDHGVKKENLYKLFVNAIHT